MDSDNCKVCGFTEIRLIDGYQYCVECGTQNENYLQTIVEHTFMDDGTAMYSQVKKIHIIKKNTEEMSPEWIKWHTFNFILCGFTEDLIKFGAKPSLKKKVLWIWSRYIQKYKEREKSDDDSGSFRRETVMPTIQEISQEASKEPTDGFNWTLNEEQFQKLNEDSDDEWKPDCGSVGFDSDSDDGVTDLNTPEENDTKFETKDQGISITTLLSIIFLACNFNGEDIQVSDIYRFIYEKRLPYLNCVQQYVPLDLNYRKNRDWDKFSLSIKNPPRGGTYARKAALQMCYDLKLGACVTPNICKLINHYLNELQLPEDLKIHISVLLRLVPYERLLIRNGLVPFYEGIALSYIIVTLKVLFVLDDDYEYRLSSAAQIVNEKFNFAKVHTTSIFMTSSDRLFSWTEWMQFIEFRKIYIADHFSPMAKKLYGIEIGDHLLTSVHNKFDKFNISTDRTDYADEIIMENLARFSEGKKSKCREEIYFPTSLTPMQTYTKILMETGELTDVKDNVLSESFTSYSLEYVTFDGKNDMCQEINMDMNTLIPSVENKEVICKTKNPRPVIKHEPGTVYAVDCPDSSDWVEKNCVPDVDVDWISVMRDVNEQCPLKNKQEILDLDDPYPLVEADLPELDPISDESDNEVEELFDKPDMTDETAQNSPLDTHSYNSFRTDEARQELINKMLSAVMKKYRIYLNVEPPARRKRKAKESNGSEEKKVPTKRVREVGAISAKEEINMIISKYLEKIESEEVEKASETNDNDAGVPEPASECNNEANVEDGAIHKPPITENELLEENPEHENQDVDETKYTAAWWDEEHSLKKIKTRVNIKLESFSTAVKRTSHLVDEKFKQEVDDDSEMGTQAHLYWLGHHHRAEYMPDKKWFPKNFYWLLMECCGLIDCKQPADLYNEVKKLEIYLTSACN